jgi:hypothetical protein
MTLNLTPKQLAEIIANAVRSTFVQAPAAGELESAARAIGNNAAQALMAYDADAE